MWQKPTFDRINEHVITHFEKFSTGDIRDRLQKSKLLCNRDQYTFSEKENFKFYKKGIWGKLLHTDIYVGCKKILFHFYYKKIKHAV